MSRTAAIRVAEGGARAVAEVGLVAAIDVAPYTAGEHAPDGRFSEAL